MGASIQVIDDWNVAIDRKEESHAIFFDFAKAFDLDDHQVLTRNSRIFFRTGSVSVLIGPRLPLFFDDSHTERVISTKYLGIYLNEKLDWREQWDSIRKRPYR